ncbi:alpha/beta fold hydrolase [Niveibacterium sp. 24ML]|uniref:YqiA/YcfP family alpha/beta fold hydrolase n=1 Tax=Niveibacterium sp. 24ML TaxID=2985512 RepID=UPI0022711F97|nr:YqiA/YcfP family alpha/beta fold hydrolase [Niveibacterium sp. 24ML]MCX9155466.1 alpha/beta fold hydrolase [Niveibacterium sp. 24ML]
MIIYLHGFRSSPASSKAQDLHARLTQRGAGDQFWCDALSHAPATAIAQAEAAIAAAPRRPTLVGSSLGGFYATWLAEKHDLNAVLINPAVFPEGFDARPFVGRHANLYTGEEFDFTWDHVAQIEALRLPAIARPQRFWLLAEEEDEVLDTRIAVARFAGAKQTVLPGGDHSFTRWPDYIDAIIEFAGIK